MINVKTNQWALVVFYFSGDRYGSPSSWPSPPSWPSPRPSWPSPFGGPW